MAQHIFYIVYEDLAVARPSNHQVVETTNGLRAIGAEVTLLFPYRFNSPLVNQLRSQVIFICKRPFALFRRWRLGYFGWHLFRYIRSQTLNAQICLYFRHTILLPLMVWLRYALPQIQIAYEAHRLVNNRFSRWCEHYLFNHGTQLITISDALRQQYVQRYGMRVEKVLVAHDGVNIEIFKSEKNQTEARQALDINTDGKLLAVYAGTLWLVKGIDLIFEVAAQLPEYIFYLVGKHRFDFDAWLVGRTVPANIILIPPVEQAEVALYLKAADVLLLPHPDNNLSQSPLKAFEYLASGTPIVASRIAQLEEILPENSLWFKPGDQHDFIRVLKAVPEEMARQQALSGERIAQANHYSWRHRADLIYSFLK